MGKKSNFPPSGKAWAIFNIKTLVTIGLTVAATLSLNFIYQKNINHSEAVVQNFGTAGIVARDVYVNTDSLMPKLLDADIRELNTFLDENPKWPVKLTVLHSDRSDGKKTNYVADQIEGHLRGKNRVPEIIDGYGSPNPLKGVRLVTNSKKQALEIYVGIFE